MSVNCRCINPILLISNPLSNVLLVIFSSIALGLVSQISIPIRPVPITFQSAFVIFLGLTLGRKRALAVVLLYLIEGVAGLPVFAEQSSGLHVLLGPSGGYLLGFLPSAFLAGLLMEIGFAKSQLLVFSASLFSVIPIFILGLIQLHYLVGWDRAIETGVYPFLITEPIKLLLTGLAIKNFWYLKN